MRLVEDGGDDERLSLGWLGAPRPESATNVRDRPADENLVRHRRVIAQRRCT